MPVIEEDRVGCTRITFTRWSSGGEGVRHACPVPSDLDRLPSKFDHPHVRELPRSIPALVDGRLDYAARGGPNVARHRGTLASDNALRELAVPDCEVVSNRHTVKWCFCSPTYVVEHGQCPVVAQLQAASDLVINDVYLFALHAVRV
ncbi:MULTISPECIES: hypothetical protein [Streptomyces]|uniref:Uncharacterized protein n=1 Tax=Streptomyces parvus TaxID=66428 RepID=A0A5D4JIE9_9ACTN|nr:hypothetical protein [Streptomyces parvus]TYR64654.1 hypothetical protein FY004_10455 [Streptomyces parvus]